MLLLRREGNWIISSYRVCEKKVLLEAVIGVVGVLGTRMGLELERSSFARLDLTVVGIVSGPRFSGGRVRGTSCFLVCPSSLSPVRVGTKELFRMLVLLLTFGVSVWASKFVLLDVLFRLVESFEIIDFFLSTKYVSMETSFGDS